MAESKIYFIDTNIFLRALILEDEQMTRRSTDFLSLVKQGKIKACLNDLVLAEVNWVLRQVYSVSKERRIKSIKGIIGLKNLKVVSGINFLFALDLYEQFNIKFIDALIAASDPVQKKKAVIVSYDKDFDKIKSVKRLSPDQVLKKYK
jgi:predicted nucleic acid-binding protein